MGKAESNWLSSIDSGRRAVRRNMRHRHKTMEKGRAKELWTGVALLVISGVVQWPLFDRMIIPMDEGHLAATAQWMLDGQRLYADLHTGIFPGIYLLTTGLFALFGNDLLVTRWVAAAINIVVIFSLWRIGRRIVSPTWAIVPSLLHLGLIAFAFPVLSMFNYSTTALAFSLLALLFLLRYLEHGRLIDGLALGFWVAAATLTKQNFGALTFLSLWIGLMWGRRESALAGRSWTQTLQPIVSAGLGLSGAVLIWMLWSGILPAFIDRTIVSLGGSQLQHFDNPIPPLFSAHPAESRFTFLYTPPALFDALVHGQPFLGLEVNETLRSAVIRITYGAPILVLMASVLLLARDANQQRGLPTVEMRSVILFAGFFSLGIFPSAIWSHLAFVLPAVFLLAVLLADRMTRWLRRQNASRSLGVWAFLLMMSGAILIAATVQRSLHVTRWNDQALNLERAHLKVSERDQALLVGAINFIEDCAKPGEAVVALPDIPVVWFLADRANASRFDLAIPGAVDEIEIVQGLRLTPIRCLVINPSMYPEFPPFKQLYPRLAATIEQDYRGGQVISAGNARWIGLVRRNP